MQFKALSLPLPLSLLAALASSALGAYTGSHTVSVSYDESYDNPYGAMDAVACSDGAYGLKSKGYGTFGALRHFPYIGGTAAVPGWNSDQCGTCWELSWRGRSVYVVALDHAQDGWNVAHAAMDALTGGQASMYGRIDAIASPVESWRCGF
ncbi:Cerato-platanin [Daedaleopsis nitida]|nr:Cerato-platanin [Daedaleopsis nitida]